MKTGGNAISVLDTPMPVYWTARSDADTPMTGRNNAPKAIQPNGLGCRRILSTVAFACRWKMATIHKG